MLKILTQAPHEAFHRLYRCGSGVVVRDYFPLRYADHAAGRDQNEIHLPRGCNDELMYVKQFHRDDLLFVVRSL